MANKRSRKRNNPKLIIAIAVIVAVIVIAIIILWCVKPQLFHKYLGVGKHEWSEWQVTQADCGNNGSKKRECKTCGEEDKQVITATGEHDFGDDGICKVCGFDGRTPSEASLEEVAESDLSIHFLELGNKYTGDCTLIKCGDTEVLIDAGSRQNSATTIKSYVDQYCTDGVLEYVIATHAHQDHIAGFVGSNSGNTKTGILYQYKVGTLIQFSGTNATSQIYNNYLTAVEYAKEQGATVYTAKQCWYETDGAQKTYYLDEAQKISLNILYQRYYDELDKNDENNYSVCTLLTQVTENKTYNYLFTGDLEAEGESSLVENNNLPEVELFKGGHHGSYTASTEKLLSVIKPKNVAVCCCCGTTEYTSNKDNTFPAQAFIDRVSKYTENMYCTTLMIDYKAGTYESMNGNIVFYYRKEESALKLYCSNNSTILKDTEWFRQNRVWKG
ncbi:MAG: MBL fold metallo-hydrolase [Clostridia bacterium]|nr:MBL fold metallo-hydrolase [Clostridia bacterium]